MSYKLRATLVGHEMDVRGVAPSLFPTEGIITVSRDQSCRVWAPVSESNSFKQEFIFYGHTKYVSSVCTIPPSEQYPKGLIATGGNDSIILVFNFESEEPVLTLTGHSGAVCSLDASKYGTILSGSWDKTAKVWNNGKVVMNLDDHEAAVWAVKMLPDKGLMLTGSADKTIKLWKAGKCEHTYIGHNDCVRGLDVLPSNQFLSCSNDGTIRKWLLTGDCLQVYEGHTNYIYSVAVIPGTTSFVSSAEDRTLKVWCENKCEQTITLPCQSVWSVGALENGDIFAGSSDSLCRVFTKDPERQASEKEIKEFEETVANQAIPAANLDLGEIKVNQLPGPEALHQPGIKPDQTKLIKNNGVVEAHQWDSKEKEWKKVGEVTGAAGGEDATKTSSGKTIFEGKEYDYVFDVDISEDKPRLKLPYNLTDDPWHAANSFLQKNDISPMFLDQVANFIIKNTEGQKPPPTNSQYQDPFTGAGQYVPGTATASSGSQSDPFTGAGRYVPPGSDAAISNRPRLFPEKNYLKFSTGKHEQITSKIREFNGQIGENQLSEQQLQVLSDSLSNLLKGATQLHNEVYDTLSDVIKTFSLWPHDKLVPVLDSIRVLVLNDVFCSQIFSETNGDKFIDSLISIAGSGTSIPNSMLVFRIFTNVFTHGKPSFVMYQKREEILECCGKVYSENEHKNLRIALSSYLVNVCIYCRNISLSFEDCVQLCSILHQFLPITSESESTFRLLVAIGTLISGKDDVIAFAQSLELQSIIQNIKETVKEKKVIECSNQLMELLC